MHSLRLIIPIVMACVMAGLQSCCTLYNHRDQNIRIYTTRDLALRKIDSTQLSFHNNGMPNYFVKRSENYLRLEFQAKDSIRMVYCLDSRLSPEYFMNFFSPLWIGVVVDAFSQKRFMYPRRSYFSYDSVNHHILRSNVSPNSDGLLKLRLGWNCVNGYHSSLIQYYNGSSSFLGLGAQAEYFVSPSRSVFLEGGYSKALGSFAKRYKINMPEDSIIHNELSNYWFVLGGMLHHRGWHVGAGICVSPFSFYQRRAYYKYFDTIVQYNNRTDTVSYPRLMQEKRINTAPVKVGLCLNLGYQLSDYWLAGINWQCYFGDADKRKIYASHFFNVYLAFNVLEFNLKRRKDPYGAD